MADALNRAGEADSGKLRDALAATRTSGLMVPFSFTPGRDPASTDGVVLLEMRGGKFGVLAP